MEMAQNVVCYGRCRSADADSTGTVRQQALVRSIEWLWVNCSQSRLGREKGLVSGLAREPLQILGKEKMGNPERARVCRRHKPTSSSPKLAPLELHSLAALLPASDIPDAPVRCSSLHSLPCIARPRLPDIHLSRPPSRPHRTFAQRTCNCCTGEYRRATASPACALQHLFAPLALPRACYEAPLLRLLLALASRFGEAKN